MKKSQNLKKYHITNLKNDFMDSFLNIMKKEVEEIYHSATRN